MRSHTFCRESIAIHRQAYESRVEYGGSPEYETLAVTVHHRRYPAASKRPPAARDVWRCSDSLGFYSGWLCYDHFHSGPSMNGERWERLEALYLRGDGAPPQKSVRRS